MDNIYETIESHIGTIELLNNIVPQINEICNLAYRTIKDDGKIIWMGNGGSAADSQHLAAEFVGRFVEERKGLPSIALTTDTSILTAVGNDYGFENVFKRQIEALCNSNDLVIGISTSGNSKNVIEAVELSSSIGASSVGLTGEHGGILKEKADLCLKVPSGITARIQEAHILIGHIICEQVEKQWMQIQ